MTRLRIPGSANKSESGNRPAAQSIAGAHATNGGAISLRHQPEETCSY